MEVLVTRFHCARIRWAWHESIAVCFERAVAIQAEDGGARLDARGITIDPGTWFVSHCSHSSPPRITTDEVLSRSNARNRATTRYLSW